MALEKTKDENKLLQRSSRIMKPTNGKCRDSLWKELRPEEGSVCRTCRTVCLRCCPGEGVAGDDFWEFVGFLWFGCFEKPCLQPAGRRGPDTLLTAAVGSLAQAFSEYQIQQMTANFVDQFGFNDEEFADQDDNIK